MYQTPVAIVGGGLAGLTAARRLHDAGLAAMVLEARPRLGGRIDSLVDDHGRCRGDLGPSWIWPPFQPVVQQWLDHLSLAVFDQYESGDAILDGFAPQPVRRPLPGQYGMARVVGGQEQFIRAMSAPLPDAHLLTDTPVEAVETTEDGKLRLWVNGRPTVSAEQVVLAAPLRIIHAHIDLPAALTPQLADTLASTPTWMAAQAKVVVQYDRPFWRSMGLSGRVASRTGPLFEVHDHSFGDDAAALFGFVATPPGQRHEEGLREAIIEQLERCFGPPAAAPVSLTIRDWATDPWICAEADLTGPVEHPRVASNQLRQGHLDDRLWFCSAETATQSPGLIEGALSAGDSTANAILQAREANRLRVG